MPARSQRSLLTGAGLALVLGFLVEPTAGARTLSMNDRGPDVRALNERLASLGYLPAGEPTERFGLATLHAVMALQKWHSLERDGVTGPRTQRALARSERPVPQSRGPERRIEVLYTRQVALLIEGGKVRRTISVSTGADGYRTPFGTFRVYRKERRSWSVPYKVWLPYASYAEIRAPA